MSKVEQAVKETLEAFDEIAKKHNLYDWDDLEAVEALEKEFHRMALFHPVQLRRNGD